ncbi:bactofilin family protein, partial [Brevundimonas sp.]
AASVLGTGMTFEGDISGVGQLIIEGVVKGDVRVSQVLINEKGTVEGTVHADLLDVRGRISGAIVAKQVRLHPTSRVEGDITQEQITIERGAWFSGRSTQAKRGDEPVGAD